MTVMRKMDEDAVNVIKEQMDTLRRELKTIFEEMTNNHGWEGGFWDGMDPDMSEPDVNDFDTYEWQSYCDGYEAGANMVKFINGEIP